jgi:nucleoside-diphosphate-sugar epimerase
VDVVGGGFLAGHLTRAFGERYSDVTVIAAGVSRTTVASSVDFDREAALVYRVVRQCHQHGGTVVFLSTASDSMYGAPDSPGDEDGPVFPITPYGRHKLCLESVVATSGVRWLVLRLSHIVGSGQQPHQLVPALVAQIGTGAVTVYQNNYRDLLDVHHLMAALDGLLACGATDMVVNVASGIPQRVPDIVTEIERRLGVRARRKIVESAASRTVVATDRLRKFVPAWQDLGFGPAYLGALLDRYIGPVRDRVPVLDGGWAE